MNTCNNGLCSHACQLKYATYTERNVLPDDNPTVFEALPDQSELVVLPDGPELCACNLDLLDRYGSEARPVVFARLRKAKSEAPPQVFAPILKAG